MRTEPVKYSAGASWEGCEPPRMIFIVCESSLEAAWGAPDPEAIPPRLSLAQLKGSRESNMTISASSFISVLPIQGLVVCDAVGNVVDQSLFCFRHCSNLLH